MLSFLFGEFTKITGDLVQLIIYMLCWIVLPYTFYHDFTLIGNKQTSELEEKCATLGDELQKRFQCPYCNQDNSAELSEILQPCDGC